MSATPDRYKYEVQRIFRRFEKLTDAIDTDALNTDISYTSSQFEERVTYIDGAIQLKEIHEVGLPRSLALVVALPLRLSLCTFLGR